MALDDFSVSELSGAGADLDKPTTLDFGPDGRLYVGTQSGLIRVLDVERSGDGYVVADWQDIDLVQAIPNHDDDGTTSDVANRQVTGILVAGTPKAPEIYVTSSDTLIREVGEDTNLDTNSGILSRIVQTTPGSWDGAEKTDLVRGLPRSEGNHSTNGIALDEASGTLYLAQGDNTNAGATSYGFSYLPETPLSAAVLEVDLAALAALPVQGTETDNPYVYDLPTLGQTPTPFGGQDGPQRDIRGAGRARPGLRLRVTQSVRSGADRGGAALHERQRAQPAVRRGPG